MTYFYNKKIQTIKPTECLKLKLEEPLWYKGMYPTVDWRKPHSPMEDSSHLSHFPPPPIQMSLSAVGGRIDVIIMSLYLSFTNTVNQNVTSIVSSFFSLFNSGASNRLKWLIFIFANKAGRKRRGMALLAERWLASFSCSCPVHELPRVLQCSNTGNTWEKEIFSTWKLCSE